MRPGGLSRRRMIAGTAVAGVATALGATLAMAQTDESTPNTDGATPSAEGTPAVGGVVETTEDDAADLLASVDEAIADAQADRDAAGSAADLTTVDQLLTQASGLRDKAQAATDEDEQRRLARAGVATAKAAGDLVEAQLSAYGLPSQQAPASRVLADASERITEIGNEIEAGADVDADAALASAQQVYAAAYDAYNAGTYAQAAKAGRVAERLAQVAAVLSGEDVRGDIGGFGGGPGRTDRQREMGPGRGSNNDDGPEQDGGPDTDDDEPVEVPSPSV